MENGDGGAIVRLRNHMNHDAVYDAYGSLALAEGDEIVLRVVNGQFVAHVTGGVVTFSDEATAFVATLRGDK